MTIISNSFLRSNLPDLWRFPISVVLSLRKSKIHHLNTAHKATVQSVLVQVLAPNSSRNDCRKSAADALLVAAETGDRVLSQPERTMHSPSTRTSNHGVPRRHSFSANAMVQNASHVQGSCCNSPWLVCSRAVCSPGNPVCTTTLSDSRLHSQRRSELSSNLRFALAVHPAVQQIVRPAERPAVRRPGARCLTNLRNQRFSFNFRNL